MSHSTNTNLTKFISFKDEKGYRSSSSLLLQDNSMSNHYIHNNGFYPMMSNSLDGKLFSNCMITNNTNSNPIENNMNDENNVFGKSFKKIDGNIPQIIHQAPIYENYMNKNGIGKNCHLSKVIAHVIQASLVEILQMILENSELKIDFKVNNINKFQVFGRVFTTSLSNFVIQIYKLQKNDNNGNISVIKIEHTFGDSFGFYKLESLLLEKLENRNIICKKNNYSFGNYLSIENMDLDSLTLESLDTPSNSDNEDYEFEDIDMDMDMDVDVDVEFDNNLCQGMLETLYNKKSYREEYMHDSYQLSKFLSENNHRSNNFINYILKYESQTFIKNIIKPIISNNMFCTFVILHVLESINIILNKLKQENIKNKLNIPKSFENDIKNIYQKWSNPDGVKNNLNSISVKFIKSQQIEKICQAILNIIE